MRRKNYDAAYKRRAILLSESLGSIKLAARELGICPSLLGKWRRASQEHISNPFPGKGNERLSEDQQRIKELERELREAQLDLEVLKKAVGFFSRAER